jgi:hypothetical protein
MTGRDKEAEAFMSDCEGKIAHAGNYGLHIHGFLLIWFYLQRQKGNLTKVENKKFKSIGNAECEYTGEVDQDGQLCGFG